MWEETTVCPPTLVPACDGGKLCLLFLIKRGPNNPGVWRKWLERSTQEHYSIKVHAKITNEVYDPLFKSNLIEAVPTQWGDVSLVQAHLALLREGLKDPLNRVFVLLSDACLPLVSFEEAREGLGMGGGKWEDDASLFDMHDPKQQKAQREYLKEFLAKKNVELGAEEREVLEMLSEHSKTTTSSREAKNAVGICAHSQWCVLSRRHAEILCSPDEEGRRNLWFTAYTKALSMTDIGKNMTLAPDELFILSYLRDFSRRTETALLIKDRKITYARCCLDADRCTCGPERAKHPQTLKNLHPVFMGHCVNTSALFGRKFAPKVEDGEGWVWWHRLWEVKDERRDRRDEQKIEIAKLCHWDCSLRDPQSTSRPTARQQEQLATYKSLHPPPHATYKREMSDLYIDPQLHASSSSQGVSGSGHARETGPGASCREDDDGDEDAPLDDEMWFQDMVQNGGLDSLGKLVQDEGLDEDLLASLIEVLSCIPLDKVGIRPLEESKILVKLQLSAHRVVPMHRVVRMFKNAKTKEDGLWLLSLLEGSGALGERGAETPWLTQFVDQDGLSAMGAWLCDDNCLEDRHMAPSHPGVLEDCMLPCLMRILQAISFRSWKDAAKLLRNSKILRKLNKRIKHVDDDTHKSQWKTLKEKILREVDFKKE